MHEYSLKIAVNCFLVLVGTSYTEKFKSYKKSGVK